MDWIIWSTAAAVFIAWAIFQRRTMISVDRAVRLLGEGARVIDVRTPGEFAQEHLRDALNIPLGRISELLPAVIPDQNAVLLLHCHGGGRSALGVRRLKALGYPRSFNLGSYGRARSILEAAQQAGAPANPPPGPR